MMWEKQPKQVKDLIEKSLKAWFYTSRIFSRKDKVKRLFNVDRKED